MPLLLYTKPKKYQKIAANGVNIGIHNTGITKKWVNYNEKGTLTLTNTDNIEGC